MRGARRAPGGGGGLLAVRREDRARGQSRGVGAGDLLVGGQGEDDALGGAAGLGTGGAGRAGPVHRTVGLPGEGYLHDVARVASDGRGDDGRGRRLGELGGADRRGDEVAAGLGIGGLAVGLEHDALDLSAGVGRGGLAVGRLHHALDLGAGVRIDCRAVLAEHEALHLLAVLGGEGRGDELAAVVGVGRGAVGAEHHALHRLRLRRLHRLVLRRRGRGLGHHALGGRLDRGLRGLRHQNVLSDAEPAEERDEHQRRRVAADRPRRARTRPVVLVVTEHVELPEEISHDVHLFRPVVKNPLRPTRIWAASAT